MEKLKNEKELEKVTGGNGNLSPYIHPHEHVGKEITADELVVGNEYIFIHNSLPDIYVGYFIKIYTNSRNVKIVSIKDDSGIIYDLPLRSYGIAEWNK